MTLTADALLPSERCTTCPDSVTVHSPIFFPIKSPLLFSFGPLTQQDLQELPFFLCKAALDSCSCFPHLHCAKKIKSDPAGDFFIAVTVQLPNFLPIHDALPPRLFSLLQLAHCFVVPLTRFEMRISDVFPQRHLTDAILLCMPAASAFAGNSWITVQELKVWPGWTVKVLGIVPLTVGRSRLGS